MSAFIVSELTMHRAIHAIAEPGMSCAQLDELGARLFALNAQAVSQRYRETADYPEGYSHNPQFLASKLQLLKSLNCLIYQCSEGNVMESPLYRELTKKRNRMMSEIICRLPEYNAAQWD